MTDYGHLTVTASCPYDGCDGTDDVRVYGANSTDVYKIVVCSTCGETYSVKVAITATGAVTEYELTT